MKTTNTISILLLPLLLSAATIMTACTKEIERPEVTSPLMPDRGPEGTGGSIGSGKVESVQVFHAGAGGEVFRIPSIVTANDGSLVIFCEDRHNSWQDKSYTDVVAKRSTDGGKNWSAAVNITKDINSGDFAYMDPTPVVDRNTGEIFLFFCRWNKLDTNTRNNRAFMSRSSDNGATWTAPEDVSDRIILPGMYSAGFGPGHGIMVSTGKYAGRLVVITRQSNGTSNSGYAIYSDDHGKTWKTGAATTGAESQIAECGTDRLYQNLRKGSDRYYTYSTDGGHSWATPLVDSSLPEIEGGCEASVLGTGENMVFYCGPKGGPKTTTNDNRYGLTLYRSATGGNGWSRSKELYSLASGYSDMTTLEDGRLVIVFEAGPEKGFIRKGGTRPAGWMRLDVLIIPKEVTDYDYWFE